MLGPWKLRKSSRPQFSIVLSPTVVSKFPFGRVCRASSISLVPASLSRTKTSILEDRLASLLISVAFQIYWVPAGLKPVLIHEHGLPADMQQSPLGNLPQPWGESWGEPEPRAFFDDSIKKGDKLPWHKSTSNKENPYETRSLVLNSLLNTLSTVLHRLHATCSLIRVKPEASSPPLPDPWLSSLLDWVVMLTFFPFRELQSVILCVMLHGF